MSEGTRSGQNISIDELLWSWPSVCQRAKDEWARNFALSIKKQSKWRNWKPTDKQLALMRRMVAELYADRTDDDAPLIE